MKNLVIAIPAIFDTANRQALELIRQINGTFQVPIIVLTDRPDMYEQFGNVQTIHYTKPVFSYHDKRTLLEEGFKQHDSVLVMDSDHLMTRRNMTELLTFDAAALNPGIYPRTAFSFWMQRFAEGHSSVYYWEEYLAFCKEESFKVEGSIFIQESLFLVKRHDRIEEFLAIWAKIQILCDTIDAAHGKKVLGHAEGCAIAIAANSTELPVVELHPMMESVRPCFLHAKL